MMGDWLQIAATILQALSIALTARFAILGLSAWRRQLVGKRKFEAAEEILLITYKLQRGLTFVRNPLVLGGEGSEARDSHGAPLERMQKMGDDLAAFSRARLLAQVFSASPSRRTRETARKRSTVEPSGG